MLNTNPNRPIRYDVVDNRTGKVVKSFKDGVKCSRYCDKKDLEYGAVRYIRRPIWK